MLIVVIAIINELRLYDTECEKIKEDKIYLKEQLRRMDDITCDFVGQKIKEKVN